MVRPRPLAGHRHLAAADQADSRDRVVRGATGARRDPRCAAAGAAGDAWEARGVDDSLKGHRRQDGGAVTYEGESAPGDGITLCH
jgi:hypothetical protein